MKLTYLLSGAAAAALMVLPIAQPGTLPLGVAAAQAAQGNVSIDVFFDALGDEGEWVKHQDHSYVWVPNNVSADWAPYTHGHWANTERYGWTFVSDEPFAWAVYHYGRWGYDPEIGWYWVPGSVWAPAWVSWRRSNDVVGWAPLPPEGEGYAVNIDVSSAEPPRSYWHFVPAREFLAPDLEVVVVHDESPFDQTEPVGPVVVENNIVVNNVIGVDFIQQASGQQVTTTEVQVVKDPAEARQARQQGAVVAVEGQLAEPAQDAAPRKTVEAKEVKAPTAGKDIEATTTGSIKPNDKTQPDQLKPGAAGQATGGQRTDEQSTGNAGASGTAQPETAAPGAKPKVEGQEKAAKGTTGEENNGQAAGKPKVEGQDKAAKNATGDENGTNAAGKPKVEGQDKTAKGTTETEQPRKLKPKNGQGAAQNEEPSGQAPAATKQGEQAQGATGEEGGTKTAQKKLKKQQGGDTSGAQSENQAGNGAVKKQGQAAEEAAPNEQGQAAKGPRKLKQAEEQQPSQEKTGAIAEPKSKGGGEQAPAKNPEAAAPKAQGKANGCSAEQQAAGNC
jgi:hypothetical protein